MARGPNVKTSEIHIVRIVDWRFDYTFGIDKGRKSTGRYHDFRQLTIVGELIKPAGTRFTTVEVTVFPRDEKEPYARPTQIGGLKQIKTSYVATCSVPADAFSMVLQSFGADRYRYIYLAISKGYSGRSEVTMISFERELNDEDL